jgi:hypothetical protein
MLNNHNVKRNPQRQFPDKNDKNSSDGNNTSPNPLLRTAVLVSAISLPCFLFAAAHAIIDLLYHQSANNLHLDIPKPGLAWPPGRPRAYYVPYR